MCIYSLLQVKDSTVYETSTGVIKKKKSLYSKLVLLLGCFPFFPLNGSFGTGLLLHSVSAKYLQIKYMCIVTFPFMPHPIQNSLPANGTERAPCPQSVFL